MGIQGVEEVEISDSASVEEISEEDFKPKPEAASAAKAKPESRVWTMQDVYKYQYKSGYSAGLYNLAWAQAVQNKPLNAVIDLEADKDGDRVVIDVSGDGVDDEIVDVEKEDGELEEGEIDLDWEPPAKAAGEGDEGISEVELRRVLESISSSDSSVSFEGQCLKLEHSLEGLCKLVGLDRVPGKDSLAESFLAALQALHSDFSTMDPSKKTSNKEIWKRLLSLVSGNKFSFLSSKQLQEIENMVGSLDTPSVVSAAAGDKDKDAQFADGSSGASSAGPNGPQNQIAESFKSGLKGRVLIPLLDLHKDHDADSLPSPTRQASPALALPRSFSSADGMFQPDFGSRKLTNGTEDFRLHPYETEALKALSSYQQKFSRTPSFTSDRLPSPTPSEEGASGADDVGGEVSSLATGSLNLSVPVRSLPSPSLDSANVQAVNSSRSVHASTVPKLPARLSAKSRDPRLRIINADSAAPDMTQQSLPSVTNFPRIDTSNGIISSRKQRDIGDPNIGGSETKRPKLVLGNPVVPMDVITSSGGGGFLKGTAHSGWQTLHRSQGADVPSDPRKVDNRTAFTIGNNNKTNVTVSGTETLRVPRTSSALSLPDLLKGIAVNPTMLMNLLKMGEQHGLVPAESQQKPADAPKITSMPFSTNSKLGVTPVSTAPMTPDVFQRPVGNPQVPAQVTSVDDTSKIRKARDPRRFLHENMLQRSASSGSEAANGVASCRPQVEPPQDKRPVPSQPAVVPDISQQLTKNLKKISPSQALPSPPVVSSNHTSLPLQTSSGMEMRTARNGELQNEISPVVDTGVSIASRSPNSWGDVEHLFEGYDDQQKAAIQQERARRLEEQKKMFATRKLCLVLDLDHTLLNSAKFGEVAPIHDEILRRKEEQDREKPQRHLFRFPHMGMWTKLRPGIWTFLEKASQLYEMHLYTMGNKLYATEMAKVLDPSGALFAGRVISRGDDGDTVDGDDRYPKTKDLEGVLGMESAVVIIDDSVRVWPHNKLNLIVVERYTYFPSSRRQFGLLGPSLLEIDHDERPEAGTLASSLAVIERIHQIFFSQQTLDDVDVRNILATEQRKILAGCRIVFSRVFPVGEVNPHHHPLWQTAEQFGAVCCNHIDDQVTHVVANSLGTDKVNWALSTGRFVVHTGWVEASALLYRRANEHDFSIIKP